VVILSIDPGVIALLKKGSEQRCRYLVRTVELQCYKIAAHMHLECCACFFVGQTTDIQLVHHHPLLNEKRNSESVQTLV
jgi:hypothetical protein